MLRALLVITICTVTEADAQLQKWLVRTVTGEVRLMDVSGTPTLGPVIPGFGQGASEDVNVMTDVDGNLLFCTAAQQDGTVQVRTANMSPMPNGSGLFGGESSQVSSIVPRPCHPGQYYIVHTDQIERTYYYSIIDMAQNGGQGAVTEKNLPLEGEWGEGMAVSHQLGTGCRWLFLYTLDDERYILHRAVISSGSIGIPEPIDTITVFDGADWWSSLKLSPQNDRIAMGLPNSQYPSDPDIAVWPLDIASGTVGDVAFHAVSPDPVSGIEFSPAGGYLYFTGISPIDTMDFGRLRMADGAVEIIDPFVGAAILHLETAANGRLYVAANSFVNTLGEVRFPDAADLADISYDRWAVLIWAGGCGSGLPNAIEGEPPGTTTTPAYINFSVEELPTCGHQFTSDACLATSWVWHFGDGNTSTEDRPLHFYDVGSYDVTLEITSCDEPLSLTLPDLVTVTGLQPEAHMTHPDTVCQRAFVPLTNTSVNASSYSWDLGNGTTSSASLPYYEYPSPGDFDISLVAREGCVFDTVYGHITVLPSAIASFTTNSDPCDEQLRLYNTSIDGASWYWDFGDGDTSDVRDPAHTYTEMNAFNVVLISDPYSMCADTAQQTLYAGYGIIPVAWFIPNAFTPNGDDINDVLRIKGPEVCASPIMSIFNKWGQPLWEGDSSAGWDGTAAGSPVPDGVYVYILHGKLSMSHGYVVLLR